jgi:hypothetical protein
MKVHEYIYLVRMIYQQPANNIFSRNKSTSLT